MYKDTNYFHFSSRFQFLHIFCRCAFWMEISFLLSYNTHTHTQNEYHFLLSFLLQIAAKAKAKEKKHWLHTRILVLTTFTQAKKVCAQLRNNMRLKIIWFEQQTFDGLDKFNGRFISTLPRVCVCVGFISVNCDMIHLRIEIDDKQHNPSIYTDQCYIYW